MFASKTWQMLMGTINKMTTVIIMFCEQPHVLASKIVTNLASD